MKAFCLASLALSVLVMPASAQQRTFYDSSGRVTGRAVTGGNTTTFYAATAESPVEPPPTAVAQPRSMTAPVGPPGG